MVAEGVCCYEIMSMQLLIISPIAHKLLSKSEVDLFQDMADGDQFAEYTITKVRKELNIARELMYDYFGLDSE